MSYGKQRCDGIVTLLLLRHLTVSTTVNKGMSVGALFKYLILLISLLPVVPVYSKNIQCKGLDNSTTDSFFLPDKYSVNVEVKLMDEKAVLLIREDRTENITSLKVTSLTHVVHCVYHYPQKQLVTVTRDFNGGTEECRVASLTPKTPCIPNAPWTIPLHELRQISNYSWVPENKEAPRGIESLHLELCEYDVNHKLRMKLDTYLVDNWKLPGSKNLINLIRLEYTLPSAHVISDYIDFFANTNEPDDFLLPHGTFCPGLNISNLKPPHITVPFSVNTEIADLGEIKNERLIFDHKKKLVLLKTESRNVSLGANRVIYDYNTGYKYTISLRTRQCRTPEKIRLEDFFVKGCIGKNTSCEMSDPDNYFHADKADIQYVGKRKLRGVICDVWVGKYLDAFTTKNNTIEWYYTSKSWTESIGTKQEDSVIFRMDIWEPGTETPSIHNFFDFDTNPTVWSQFDISPCYSKHEDHIRFTIRLQANGSKDLLPYTTNSSAVQHLQEELASWEGISPILFSQTMVDYDMNASVVYLTSTLLSGPKESNQKFTTKKPKAMKDVFESMSQGVRSKTWNVSIPIQIGSKLKKLSLTADEIWQPATKEKNSSSDASTTPSSSTAPKTSPSQNASTQSTAPNKTTPSITTAASSTAASSTDTKIATPTSNGITTANPTMPSSTTLSTNGVTTLLTKQTSTIPRLSSTIFPSGDHHSQSTLQQTTRSSAQTTPAKTPTKSSGPSRFTGCICPTISTNSSSRTANVNKDKGYTVVTLIAFVCGSFGVGMLFAFVLVSIHSAFCRRRANGDSDSENHRLTSMPYSQLE